MVIPFEYCSGLCRDTAEVTQDPPSQPEDGAPSASLDSIHNSWIGFLSAFREKEIKSAHGRAIRPTCRDKREVKTRTLENRKGAAPKIFPAASLSATRQLFDLDGSSCSRLLTVSGWRSFLAQCYFPLNRSDCLR